MVMICVENIQLLIERNREDVDALDLIEDCLNSFDEYHAKIYRMETWSKLYGYHNMSKDDYQSQYAALDRSRTISHNTVIGSIGILNRLCEQRGIPLVYEGIVSEDRQHRIALADAVLAYVESVVANRVR